MKAPEPEHCPGTESENAGKSDACQGCPNQKICASAQPAAPDPDLPLILERLKPIKKKILILSGKGGVGKSTTTCMISRGLRAYLSELYKNEDNDYGVGVLDIDICGPSLPRIFGIEGQQVHGSGSGYSPVFADENLSVMSSGFLIPLEAPVIWRGPKKNGLIKKLLKDVDWGELDYLIIDTPPGTSDEHLSIIKYLQNQIDGCVLVTTPNEVSLLDVKKQIDFVRNPEVNLKILGVVENMSGFSCPKCSVTSDILPRDSGGAAKMCQDLGLPLLASIPIDPKIAQATDEGIDIFQDEEYKNSTVSKLYKNLIQSIIKQLE